MDIIGKKCPFCENAIENDENIVICSLCKIPHHLACWRANNGCTSYNCNGEALTIDEFESRENTPICYIPYENQNFGDGKDQIDKTPGSQFAGFFDNIQNDESKEKLQQISEETMKEDVSSSIGDNIVIEEKNIEQTNFPQELEIDEQKENDINGLTEETKMITEDSFNENNSSLINCPDCGNLVSYRAVSCPRCGCPIAQSVQKDDDNKKPKAKKEKREKKKIKPARIIIPIFASLVVLALLFCGYYFFSPKTFQWCCYHNISPANCVIAQTCNRCGKSWGEPLGHDWEKATCTEPQTCKVCGETQGTPLGHSWKDADCYNPKECTRCGLTEGKPREHSYSSATCTEAAKCRYCGKTKGSPLGHNYVDYICTRCQKCYVTKSDIPNILEIVNQYYEINYVGGVDWHMTFKNKSDKTINYIDLTIQFYNKVGDVLYDDITRDDYCIVRYTGPLKAGKTSSSTYWRACFYNSTYSGTTNLKEIKITYSDGSVLTIPSPVSNYAVVSWR